MWIPDHAGLSYLFLETIGIVIKVNLELFQANWSGLLQILLRIQDSICGSEQTHEIANKYGEK